MRRLALLAVLLILASPLAASAMASPQPTPVCRFCGGLFESAAEEAGVNVTVASSTVDVHLHRDGAATWVVELELSKGTAALDASGNLDSIARSLAEDGRGLPEDPTYRIAGIDDDRVTLRYRAPDAADRHAGLLVVDILHDGGRQPWYHVNADRFTVHGPDGTVVANTPESGQVDESSVTWRGQSGEDWYDGTDLAGSPYVVYGSDRSAATRLRASLAVALATWPIFAGAVRTFLLLQTLLFAVLLGGVVVLVRRVEPRPAVEPLAAVLGGLGVVGVVAPAVIHSPGWQAGPPLLALGLAGLALAPTSRRWLATPRSQALAVIGLLAGAYIGLAGLHTALAREWTRPLVLALRTTAVAFPLAAMVPLGGALARNGDELRGWFVVAVAAFAAVPVTVVNLADPPAGIGAGVMLFALIGLAVLAPLVGTLALVLGRSLALVAGPASTR